MAFAAPLALVAGIAGAGISAVGQIQQGQATASAANYRAEVARNNATIAKQNADYAIQAGMAAAETQSLKGAAKGGALKAGQGASGVDLNTGSAVDVRVSQREAAALDTETVMNNAELQAYGYNAKATGFEAEAQLDEMTAEQAPIGAAFGAAGSLLSSASSLGYKWSGAGGGSFSGYGSGGSAAP